MKNVPFLLQASLMLRDPFTSIYLKESLVSVINDMIAVTLSKTDSRKKTLIISSIKRVLSSRNISVTDVSELDLRKLWNNSNLSLNEYYDIVASIAVVLSLLLSGEKEAEGDIIELARELMGLEEEEE